MPNFVYKQEKLLQAFKNLKDLYSKIPETEGCLEHINLLPGSNGNCGGFCCSIQYCQLLYCEFLHIWDEILKKWESDEVVELIESALRNYFNNTPIKGCILFNKEDKKCKIYNFRPLSCYYYGITPDGEFNNRLKMLKEKHSEWSAFFREQCKYLKCNNVVTKEMLDEWWCELSNIEKSIGIEEKYINDDMEGTYRAFHDHLLLYLLPIQQFENLSHVKEHGTIEEKEQIIFAITNIFKKTFEKIKNVP